MMMEMAAYDDFQLPICNGSESSLLMLTDLKLSDQPLMDGPAHIYTAGDRSIDAAQRGIGDHMERARRRKRLATGAASKQARGAAPTVSVVRATCRTTDKKRYLPKPIYTLMQRRRRPRHPIPSISLSAPIFAGCAAICSACQSHHTRLDGKLPMLLFNLFFFFPYLNSRWIIDRS